MLRECEGDSSGVEHFFASLATFCSFFDARNRISRHLTPARQLLPVEITHSDSRNLEQKAAKIAKVKVKVRAGGQRLAAHNAESLIR